MHNPEVVGETSTPLTPSLLVSRDVQCERRTTTGRVFFSAKLWGSGGGASTNREEGSVSGVGVRRRTFPDSVAAEVCRRRRPTPAAAAASLHYAPAVLPRTHVRFVSFNFDRAARRGAGSPTAAADYAPACPPAAPVTRRARGLPRPALAPGAPALLPGFALTGRGWVSISTFICGRALSGGFSAHGPEAPGTHPLTGTISTLEEGTGFTGVLAWTWVC